jgi:N-methylhydantoinase B
MPLDPIVTSVIQHRLHAIVEEMGEAMLRTAYSQILNSSRDFSCAICDLDGRLIAQAEHVPIHVGALPYAARRAAKQSRNNRVAPVPHYARNDFVSVGES